jgi:hypothetical protein
MLAVGQYVFCFINSDRELHVVAAMSKGEDHRRKILAVLSAIHRALVADSQRSTRRDIEFIFSVEDKVEDVTSVEHPVWALVRTANDEAVWLSDFGAVRIGVVRPNGQKHTKIANVMIFWTMRSWCRMPCVSS